MRFRSIGLGKKELLGQVAKLQHQGDYLIRHIDSLEPVRWKIRAALTYNDVVAVLRQCLRVSVLAFLLVRFRLFRPAKPVDNF